MKRNVHALIIGLTVCLAIAASAWATTSYSLQPFGADALVVADATVLDSAPPVDRAVDVAGDELQAVTASDLPVVHDFVISDSAIDAWITPAVVQGDEVLELDESARASAAAAVKRIRTEALPASITDT